MQKRPVPFKKLKNQSWLKYILVLTEAIAEKEGSCEKRDLVTAIRCPVVHSLEKLSETQMLPLKFVSTCV
ncbi:hypothetical protein TNCV_548432 [Trichonephila clavipes]|nr:hypothetical protein TNCV_548432 [Trichonephila clavipes]